MGSIITDPFAAAPPTEVTLKNAPLVRVIAQLRFPEILAVEQREFVADFQEAIRPTYPVLRPEQTQGVLLGPGGIVQTKPQVAWRFNDVDHVWRVSLTPGFMALETTKYTSRKDFLSRFRTVVGALEATVSPKLVDRLGLRYIDRIEGAAVDQISELIRPEVRGLVGTPAAQRASQTWTETLFEMDAVRMLARWGSLPPNMTLDPAAIPPIAEKSWVLDLDVFSAGSLPFEVEPLMAEAERYAERIYTFFRWAVTPAFLKRYGGKP